jgi:hypothetical protein
MTSPLIARHNLTQLVVELMLATAESDDFVTQVTLGPWSVSVRRRSAPLDPETFRLALLYTDRLGLPLLVAKSARIR